MEQLTWQLQQKLHTLKRLRDRYNMRLNKGEYDQLNSLILTKQAFYCCLNKRNSRFAVYILTFKNREILVGFDTIHKNICTALPPSNIDAYRRKASRLEKEFTKIKSTKRYKLHTSIKTPCPLCASGMKRKNKFCRNCNEARGVIRKHGVARCKRIIAHMESTEPSMFDMFINWMI